MHNRNGNGKVEVGQISTFFAMKARSTCVSTQQSGLSFVGKEGPEWTFVFKEDSMKGSGIGGQAVMEGVMMKNGDRYAVAVRKPDKEIIVKTEESPAFIKGKKVLELPKRYEALAEELGCRFFNAQTVLSEKELGGDGLHFKREGHKKLAAALEKEVRSIL